MRATPIEKKSYRTLKVPDPSHLMMRLKQGVKAGALSIQSRAKYVGEKFLLTNEGDGSQAFAVVRMGQGVAFRDGAAAVATLGAKADGAAGQKFASEQGQVWFHPLVLVESFDKPRAVGGTPVEKALSEADKADVDREDAVIAENKKTPAAGKPHKFKAAKWTHKNGHPRCLICGDEEREDGVCSPVAKDADDGDDLATMETDSLLTLFGALERQYEVTKSDDLIDSAELLLEELDGRGVEVPGGGLVTDARDLVEKGLFGYPAGKAASAKRIAAMIPAHKTYVEPFVGSGAVLFAKDRSAVEVVNDMRQDVADAWRALSKLTKGDIKQLQGRSWTGSRERWKQLMASKPSGLIEKLYKFLYTMRFGFAGAAWKGYATTQEGHTLSMPRKLENVAPRASGVRVYSGDYETVCRKYDSPNTVFFFDPPYVGTDNTVGEGKFDEGRFFKMLTQLKGRWILTYGVHGELPKMLRGSKFKVSTFATNRSARSQPNAGGSSSLQQIMATNYDPSGVSKAVASIEKRDTKGTLQKPHVCKYDGCDAQAAFAIVWANGRACVPACNKHRAYYQQKQSDVVAVRPLPQPAEKAVWSTAYQNDLEDSAFLYIAPGGEKDEDGKTVPRSLRFFPVRDHKGDIDAAHARNAIARIPQSTAPGLTPEKMEALQNKARKLLEEVKKDDDEQANGPWSRTPVVKAEELRYVFGLVLEPNDGQDGNPLDPDTQNQTYSAEEIWQAWWTYSIESGRHGLRHKQIVDTNSIVLLDNYIVPDDMTVEGQKFRKGSWVMGAHIKNDELWRQIKNGTYDAWSVQGSAIIDLMQRAA